MNRLRTLVCGWLLWSLLFFFNWEGAFAQSIETKFVRDVLESGDTSLVRQLSLLRQSGDFQIIYSKVDRGANGIPVITEHVFNPDTLFVFSASGVHLPLAMAVIEKINGIKDSGVTLNTTMITEAIRDEQMPAYNDPHWPGGRPTAGRYISNLLLLHDEASFDRLYEFLGQDFGLSVFAAKKYDIRYVRRVDEENQESPRHANPVNFYDDKSRIIYRKLPSFNNNPYPFFAGRNFPESSNLLTLESLHKLMTGLIYPQRVRNDERFRSSDEDRTFVLKNISQRPEETLYPYHDPASLNENAFFGMMGPDDLSVRCFNTGGFSDGQVIESLFVADTSNHVEYILSAAFRTKEDSDLDAVSDVLFDFGQKLYEYERKRKRAVSPDLKEFVIRYDR